MSFASMTFRFSLSNSLLLSSAAASDRSTCQNPLKVLLYGEKARAWNEREAMRKSSQRSAFFFHEKKKVKKKSSVDSLSFYPPRFSSHLASDPLHFVVRKKNLAETQKEKEEKNSSSLQLINLRRTCPSSPSPPSLSAPPRLPLAHLPAAAAALVQRKLPCSAGGESHVSRFGCLKR